jgi:peptidoglycan/LPS O-acetylase OafA/YrhL
MRAFVALRTRIFIEPLTSATLTRLTTVLLPTISDTLYPGAEMNTDDKPSTSTRSTDTIYPPEPKGQVSNPSIIVGVLKPQIAQVGLTSNFVSSDAAAAACTSQLLRRFMPELDVIRGIAVSLVLFSHFLSWSYVDVPRAPFDSQVEPWAARLLMISARPGWIGVQLFFVLSGFLITGNIIEAREQFDFVPRFYARRFARIQPALILTLLTICLLRLIGVAYTHLSDVTLPGVVAALLFCANLAPLLGVANPFGPLWSLAIEEQFYLVWPSIVRRLSIRRLRDYCFAGIFLGPFVRLIGFQCGQSEYLSYVTWFCLDGLFAGGLLACQLRINRNDRRSAHLLAWSMTAIALATLMLQYFTGSLSRQSTLGAMLGPSPWVLLSASLLVWFLCIGSNERLKRLVEIGLLQDLGFVSYGLYLYHPIVMAIADHTLGGIAYATPNANPRVQDMLWRMLVLTVASYKVARWSRVSFEEWFLARKSQFERIAISFTRHSGAQRTD